MFFAYLGDLDCWLRDCTLLSAMPSLVPAEGPGRSSIGSRLRGHGAAVLPSLLSNTNQGGPEVHVQSQVPTQLGDTAAVGAEIDLRGTPHLPVLSGTNERL